MPNYTKPHEENYEDTPEDYFYSAMTFSQALAEVLDEGQGVIIDLKGDAVKIHPDAKRVIVFSDGDMMRIINATERTDLKHGDWIQMIKKEDIEN